MSPSEYPGENPPSGAAPRALIYPSLRGLLIRERRGLEESAPTPEICTTGPFLGANLPAGLVRLSDSCYHSASDWSPSMSAYRPPPNPACPCGYGTDNCGYETDNCGYQTLIHPSCQCQARFRMTGRGFSSRFVAFYVRLRLGKGVPPVKRGVLHPVTTMIRL